MLSELLKGLITKIIESLIVVPFVWIAGKFVDVTYPMIDGKTDSSSR